MVVLDNLAVHHSKILKEYYDESFKEQFLPPYSCALNPIERLWSVVKNKWRRTQQLEALQVGSAIPDIVKMKWSIARLRAIIGTPRRLDINKFYR